MLYSRLALIFISVLGSAATAAPRDAAAILNSEPVVDFASCPAPAWPKASVRNEEYGTIQIRFLIAIDGTVKDTETWKSSGFRDLDRAALAGVKTCRFKPGVIDGKPVETWSHVEYTWPDPPPARPGK